MKARIPSILLTCLLVITAAPAFAQFDTAVVLGTVRDPNGAVLSRATVTLKNLATGITATAQTDEDGNYLPAPGILHPQPQGLGGDERRASRYPAPRCTSAVFR
ncbi:MAG TPA: carboxypeptidase-like regulatory domain-containing protein [Blastocatellia bacterium]